MIDVNGCQFTEKVREDYYYTVYRGIQNEDSDRKVIFVVFNADNFPQEDIAHFKFEAKNILALQSGGIIRYYDMIYTDKEIIQVLEDFNGVPITNIFNHKPVDMETFFNIAIQIADALGEMHKYSLVHKNIVPQNILFNEKSGVVKLCNLGFSSLIKEQYERDFPYISPEQTGKMNYPIDFRTDFYSAGIVFYELLTGELPFKSKDPLELIHCHVAKMPVYPTEVNKKIPPAISDIIMKLLSKSAEYRYKSGYGLKGDLEECAEKLQNKGIIEDFLPGKNDIPGALNFSKKLYGREKEIDALFDAFERVKQGAVEIILISGCSGIGKNTLVNELYRPVILHGDNFISGRFDQITHNAPYSAIAQAFKQLIGIMLTESEERVGEWKEKLTEALEPNGQIIAGVIPEIELIIGKQKPVPQLGPAESQNRFNMVFRSFFKVFVQRERPLVIYLKDLQWADSACLELINGFMADPDAKYVLLIGTYRDNEVTENHPLVAVIDKIKKSGITVSSLNLSLQGAEDVNRLIADTLGCDLDFTRPLSELVYVKTAGNPLFARQFINTLYEENILKYDLAYGWNWDIERIREAQVTGNIAEFMISNIEKLSNNTRKVLMAAACVGNSFELPFLAAVYRKTVDDTFADIIEAIKKGLVVKHDDVYNFSHNSILEAVYSMIPHEEKIQMHRDIGYLAWEQENFTRTPEKVFFIADQVELGKRLITVQEERYKLAWLVLAAGRKARNSFSFKSALGYFMTGTELLDKNKWRTEYELTFALYLERAECEYMAGNFSGALKLTETVLGNASNNLDKAKAYNLRILAYTALFKPAYAINVGMEGLGLFGIDFSIKLDKRALLKEVHKIKYYLFKKRNKDLLLLSDMVDPEGKAVISILNNITVPAYLLHKNLLALLALKIIGISLKNGDTDASSYAYVIYGHILCSLLGDVSSGIKFGETGLKLCEKHADLASKGKTYFMFASFLSHLRYHLKESIKNFHNVGLQFCLESGELTYAGYHISASMTAMFFKGDPIDDVIAQKEKYSDLLKRIKDPIMLYTLATLDKAITVLRGGADRNTYYFDSNEYNEEEFGRELIEKAVRVTGSYYLFRLEAAYIFGHYTDACKIVVDADLQGIFSNSSGFYEDIEYCFYRSLTLTAIYAQASFRVKTKYRKELAAARRVMKRWSSFCPQNFLHKYLLVSAEIARISGKDVEAIKLYESAIASARENGYTQNEAIACEAAAKFHIARGIRTVAETYLLEARKCFHKWGASAKVSDMDQKYQDILSDAVEKREKGYGAAHPLENAAGKLDLMTILKASQTLSEQILLDRLLTKLMHIIMENAGAQKGSLIMEKKGGLIIEAEGVVGETDVITLPSIPLKESRNLSLGIVNYVKKTFENVVLDDAVNDGRFGSEPYVLDTQPKSILCTPIIKQGKLIGILYLENNFIKNAFTPERLEILKALLSQVVISLENARLYDDLQKAHTELEIKVNERTRELMTANRDLEKSKKELERFVEVLKSNEELRKLTQELKRSNSDLEQFAYVASHDLQEPLRMVVSYLQLIELRYMNKLDDSAREFFAFAIDGASRMKILINDLLMYSRAGVQSRPMEETDCSKVLEAVLHNLQTAIAENHALISIGSVPVITGDHLQLVQLFQNLIGNAIKFRGLKPPEIFINAELSGNQWIFSVHDNGIGVEPQYFERIFVIFQRLHARAEYQGTGVGLAICKKIVERHGGRIWVESEKGKGTTFYFTIPVKGE